MPQRSGAPAKLSLEASLAARAALGSCLGSVVVLVEPLRELFSEETQPLLLNTAVIALFCAGGSLEETASLAAGISTGTFCAVLSAAAGRWLGGLHAVPVYSWRSMLVPIEATLLAGIICVLPLPDTPKMTSVGLMAYFVLCFFLDNQVPVFQLCAEFMAITLGGCLCALLAFAVPLPGLAETGALQSAARAFEDVADGCAELVTEATSAFLCSGAGDAWRAMALHRTRVVEARLMEAHRAVGFRDWSSAAILSRVSRRGRAAEAAWKMRREAAFSNAASALDTCRLLCELAVRAQADAGGVEAVAVREAAASRLAGVAEVAAALLRDSARANFVGRGGSAQGLQTETLEAALQGPDVAGRKLRRTANAALRKSSNGARDLLLLSIYGDTNEEVDWMSRSELASARSDMAAFLFLVHALCADLLRSEADVLACARASADSFPGGCCRSQRVRSKSTIVEGDEDMDEGEIASNVSSMISGDSRYDLGSLHTPLLRGRSAVTAVVRAVLQEDNPPMQRLARRGLLGLRWAESLLHSAAAHVAAAFRMRWRIALKVMLTFMPASLACIYLLKLDSTMVCTASYLCSYGSQYSGGSLRKCVNRGLGIAIGATVGSFMRQAIVMVGITIGDSLWGSIATSATAAFLTSGWAGFATMLYFRGGPYAYACFCAAFTPMKFTLAVGATAALDSVVAFTMLACLLVVAVELAVLPTRADDLLRSRLAAATAGAVAVLSTLVTSADVDEKVAITPGLARDALRYVGTSAAEHRYTTGGADPMLMTLRTAGRQEKVPSANSSQTSVQSFAEKRACVSDLPDLTERIKQAGMYDKYTSWRDGYLRWRTGKAEGSHGELTGDASSKLQKSATTMPTCAAQEGEGGVVSAAGAPHGDRALSSEAQQDAARVAAAFEPSFSEEVVGLASLDPFAAVSLPSAGANEGTGWDKAHAMAGLSGMAQEIFLPRGTPALADLASVEEQQQSPSPVELHPQLAASVPHLAELTSIPEKTEADVAFCRQISKGSTSSRTTSPTVRGESIDVEACPAPVTMVSLADMHVLLDEIGSVLAPARDLALQATESLDAERVDANAWCSLAAAIGMLRLRLTLLARIALRLRHGVGVAELLGGERREEAANKLVAAYGVALSTATSAIAGGAAPSPRVAAQLDANLRASATALVQALAKRSIQHIPAHGGGRHVAAEVLASTAGSTLVGLLRGAAEVLSWAVVLAGSYTEAPARTTVPPEAAGTARLAPGTALAQVVASELPDLTDRLKEAGKYEEYLKWREGYMRWRGGGSTGARGQIVQSTVT